MNKTTLILIDGSSYLYRAFHALPTFTNSKGIPTGAIYGITNMLKNLLHKYQPVYAAVVFDARGKTFRDELYPEYKANRQAMPEELVAQIPLAHEMVQALGFPLLMETGVEADDVIGTLAQQAQTAGLTTLIFTGDKDFAQLVNESITLIDTMKNTQLDVQGVIDKFGVLPTQMIDYLSLIGDSVDNVPGVPKVGPKTAVKWLQSYHSLAQIVENAGQIKGKVGENLRDALSYLPLSQQLVTIKCDVPLSYTPLQLTLKPQNLPKLRELYLQLEFKKYLLELPAWTETEPQASLFTDNQSENNQTNQNREHYQTIFSLALLKQWLSRLEEAKIFAFDTETTRLNYLTAEIVGVSFALTSGEAAYVPMAHDYLGVPKQLSRTTVLTALKPLLENPSLLKIGHNIKYDAHVLANYGIELQGIAFDTLLESYVLNSTTVSQDLDSLALKYLNIQTTSFHDLAGTGKKQLTFNQISIEEAAPYAAEDADITWQLHQRLWPLIQANESFKTIFQTVEMPLIPILMRMERHGVLIDVAQLQQQSQEIDQQLKQLAQLVYDMAGEEFNLNSPKQLQTILFDKLALPILKKTPKKEPSTAVEVLEELAQRYPLPKIILEYRSLSKLKSTYTDTLPRQINPQTGRIHTSYHQATTATGRLSSSQPNLQNIPIRSKQGRRIRQAFIAPQGYQILAADYSQIELRIMAHLSGDHSLLIAFQTGQDIHRHTAADIFALPFEQITHEQRRKAKTINFGLIYGMQAFSLAQQLGIERYEAQHYIDIYFARYPQVKNFMTKIREQAKIQGYVETLFGRRLYIPEIRAPNHQRRQYAERSAINAPMQGTAADLIKLAMIQVDHWIQHSGLDVKMLMQVHDELVFQIATNDLADAKPAIIEAMTSVTGLKVPLLVEVGVGNNWDEAH
jgi:DNA polymerase-1